MTQWVIQSHLVEIGGDESGRTRTLVADHGAWTSDANQGSVGDEKSRDNDTDTRNDNVDSDQALITGKKTFSMS